MDQQPDDLELELFEAKALPGGDRSPAVLIADHAFEQMTRHALEEQDHEIGGIMVGSVIEGTGIVIIVEDAIRGTHMTEGRSSVTFTHETWEGINRIKDERFPDKRIVGWYHSHPGFGIFLSSYDLFIQQNFFSQPWQVAFVTDPKAQTNGCFVWQEGEILPEPDFGILSSATEYVRAKASPQKPEGTPDATLHAMFEMPQPTPVVRRDPALSWALGLLSVLVAMTLGLSLVALDKDGDLNRKVDTIVNNVQTLNGRLLTPPPATPAAASAVVAPATTTSQIPLQPPLQPLPQPTVPPATGDPGAGPVPPTPQR